MKRVTISIIFLFCCCVHFAYAQSPGKRVVVSEKNGNVIIGDIVVENSEFIKIVKYDDKLTRIIYRSNIANITDGSNYKTKEEIYQETLEQDYIRSTQLKEEKKKRIQKELAKPQRGFQQSVEMVHNLISPSSSFYSQYIQNINYIAGYRFNDYLYLGVGAGVGFCFSGNVYSDSFYCNSDNGLFIPLHINFRSYLTKTRFQPLVNLSIGCNIPIPYRVYGQINFDSDKDFYDGDNTYECSCSLIGLMLQPGLGFNFRINGKVSMYAIISYYSTTQQEPYLDADKNIHISNKMYHGISIKWGFTF